MRKHENPCFVSCPKAGSWRKEGRPQSVGATLSNQLVHKCLPYGRTWETAKLSFRRIGTLRLARGCELATPEIRSRRRKYTQTSHSNAQEHPALIAPYYFRRSAGGCGANGWKKGSATLVNPLINRLLSLGIHSMLLECMFG
jgi:hypothetical protein